jgi:opacity protein-like surface antigen
MFLHLIVAWLIATVSSQALAQREAGYGPLYVQGMLGVLDADNAWTLTDADTGETLESDLGELIYGGGMAQQMVREGVFEYGFEGGGLVSWKNSNQTFYASNHVAAVSFDNDMFLLDLSFGGTISWRPVKPFRLYLGAGPALAIGTVDVKNETPELAPQDGTTERSNVNGREWAVGVSLYGRVGIEFIVDKFTFGVTARKTGSTLDFGQAGEIDLSGTQLFLTIGTLM